MKDFTKVPTDAAMVKAFNEFERAFNVADAMLRLAPEKAYPSGNLQAVETDRDNLFRAQRVMHNLATQAEARKEAKAK